MSGRERLLAAAVAVGLVLLVIGIATGQPVPLLALWTGFTILNVVQLAMLRRQR